MSDALTFLFSLEQFGIKFGLDHIQALTTGLGHPERAYTTVHVAGTNGKGSVTAMVDAVLRAAGVRTGRYTSPHLVALNERFAVDGVPVADADLHAAVQIVRDALNALRDRGAIDVWPTFFEVTTAAAFELFRRAGVQVAVVEVGLGGRLDATNVVSPAVTAITSIGRDHEQYLGNSIEEIAAEKAGILKAGVPVIVGDMPAGARDVITRRAAAIRSPMIVASDGVEISGRVVETGGQSIDLRTPECNYGRVTLGLQGAHQIGNAIVAVRIAEELARHGWAIDATAIRTGLSSARWPGRLERIELADGRDILLDAAHNPDGAATLARYLIERGPAHPLVFAAMRDKDVTGILRVLAAAVSVLIVTRASNPRSASIDALQQAAATVAPGLTVLPVEPFEAALEAAWRLDRSIVAAGSIFLLGDILNVVRRP